MLVFRCRFSLFRIVFLLKVLFMFFVIIMVVVFWNIVGDWF